MIAYGDEAASKGLTEVKPKEQKNKKKSGSSDDEAEILD